jgi:hypothetical protein
MSSQLNIHDDHDDHIEEGDYCYGASEPSIVRTFTMAGGGAHWWEYVVHFDPTSGEQTAVYIHSAAGMDFMQEKCLFWRQYDGNREVHLRLEWSDFDDADWRKLEYIQ